ncbi:hypothetical protein [Kaarinaea lacus]
MKRNQNIKSRQKINPVENFLLALVHGAMGFFTGLLIWFVTPVAFGISAKVYLLISVLLASVFFVIGLIRPVRTAEQAGSGWDFIKLLNRQVFHWIKLIK